MSSLITKLRININSFRHVSPINILIHSLPVISYNQFSMINIKHIHTMNNLNHSKRYNSSESVGFATESLYHSEADKVMDIVTEKCDEFFDLTSDEFDFKTASGVLTIDFGINIGTFVINKQAPNQQIWLSSPLSGPNHYDYNTTSKQWISSKDNHSLCSLLEKEFSKVTNTDIQFDEDF